MANTLLRNTLIYTVGNLGSRILSFLIVPLYSFYLTKAELGQYDLLLSSTSIFVPFIGLQVADAVYRWLIEAKGNSLAQKKAISNGLAISGITLVLFTAIYYLIKDKLAIAYADYVLLIVVLNIIFSLIQQIARGTGKNTLYSVTGLLYTGLFLGCNCTLLAFDLLSIKTLLLSTIASYLLTIVYGISKTNVLGFIDLKLINSLEMKALITYATPLIPNAVSWWLINEVNKFIILSNLGLDHNGIYAIANKFPAILTVLNSIFMLAWQDQSLQVGSDASVRQYNTEIYEKYIRLQLSLTIVLIVISKYIVMFMVSQDFYSAWKYMPLLYLGVCFSALANFLAAFYLKTKATKGLFLTTIVGGIINMIISYALIHSLGLYAPALGTFVGFLVVWVLRSRKTKEHINRKVVLSSLIGLLAIGLACVGAVQMDNAWIDVGLISLALAVFAWANYPLLASLLVKTKMMYKSALG